MKIILLFLCLSFCLSLSAQKIALIHRSFKQPITYTDSLTVEQVRSGFFPLVVNDVDTFYANLRYLYKMLKTRQRAKMESFELNSGSTFINSARVPMAYGDRYDIIANTKVGEVLAQMKLSSNALPNKKNARRIKDMMDYISKNKSLFSAPTEIHPRIYYLQVITDH